MVTVKASGEFERIAALDALRIVNSERMPEYDAVAETLASIFETRLAFISFIGENELWFKARVGIAAEGMPRKTSICQHVLQSDGLFLVPDAKDDPRFSDNPLVTGDPHIRFYAGCPLSIDGVHRLGALCVAGTDPRTPADSELQQLSRLARVTEGLIKLHKANLDTEDALRQAEDARNLVAREGDLLQEIANVSGVGGWEIDLTTDTVTWTAKSREIHEVDDAFVPSLSNIPTFYSAEARARIEAAMAKGLAEGKGWELELPLVTARGRNIWVRAAGRPILENGEPVRIVGAAQDITARKISEQSVRHSEALQRTTLETLSEGVLFLGKSGLIQSFNPAAATLLGFAPEELADKTVEDLALEVRREPGSAEDINPLLEAAVRPENVRNVTARISRTGGNHAVWLRINARSISDSNDFGLAGVVVSLTDITESKRQADTLQVIFENAPGGLVYFDETRRLAACNAGFRKLLALPQHFIDEKAPLLEIVSYLARRGDYGPGEPDHLIREQIRLFDTPLPHVYERTCPDGTVLEVHGTPLPFGGLVSSYFDITERKRMEEQLAENERQARERSDELEVVLANMRQGVSVFDRKGRLTLWNDKYVEIFGKPAGEVREGISLMELIGKEKRRGEFQGNVQEHVMDLLMRLSAGEVVRSTFRHPDGKIISAVHAPLPAGGWIGTHEDVTARELAAQKIRHAAHHDALTGLPNRAQFNARLEETVEAVQAGGSSHSLLLLDLDRFKPVNDTFGHDVGDELLKQVADRLRGCLRSSDLVARLGGDEFAVILTCPASQPAEHETADIAGRLLAAIGRPYAVLGEFIQIGVSIGIAPLCAETGSARAALKQADIALYQVKHGGRNGYRFYSDAALDSTG